MATTPRGTLQAWGNSSGIKGTYIPVFADRVSAASGPHRLDRSMSRTPLISRLDPLLATTLPKPQVLLSGGSAEMSYRTRQGIVLWN